MERWTGRVALVTGAGSGIGAAVSRKLTVEGMQVVGADCNVESVQALADELKGQRGKLTPIKCDLTKDDQVMSLFARIKRKFGGVDVCINNAGIFECMTLLDGTPEKWRKMLDINVVALCLCTREAVASMRERGVDDGHIIHINSMASHKPPFISNAHFYTATKYTVTALTEGLRQELRHINSNIKISAISPGIVKTNIRNAFLDEEATEKFYQETPSLTPDNIAASLIHILATPPEVQIHDLLIRNTQERM